MRIWRTDGQPARCCLLAALALQMLHLRPRRPRPRPSLLPPGSSLELGRVARRAGLERRIGIVNIARRRPSSALLGPGDARRSVVDSEEGGGVAACGCGWLGTGGEWRWPGARTPPLPDRTPLDLQLARECVRTSARGPE